MAGCPRVRACLPSARARRDGNVARCTHVGPHLLALHACGIGSMLVLVLLLVAWRVRSCERHMGLFAVPFCAHCDTHPHPPAHFHTARYPSILLTPTDHRRQAERYCTG
jgi:hypothetical protein